MSCWNSCLLTCIDRIARWHLSHLYGHGHMRLDAMLNFYHFIASVHGGSVVLKTCSPFSLLWNLLAFLFLWNLLAFLPFFLSFYRTCSPHVLVFSRSANQSNIRSKSEARYRSVSTDLVPSQQARKEGGLVIEVYHLLTVCVPMSLWWPTSRVAV